MMHFYINYKTNLFWILLMVVRDCSCCNINPGCRHFSNENRYSCSGRLWNDNIFEKLNVEERLSMKTLEICNMNKESLSLRKIGIKFPYLTNITIWQGNISSITGMFLMNNQIKVLQLRDLLTKSISVKLGWLKKLEVLDLSGNHLQELNQQNVQGISRIPICNLSNNHWNCSLNLEWVIKLYGSSKNDFKNLTCYQQPYQGKPLLPIAHFKKDVQMNCPEKCECSMSDVVRDPSNLELEPIIEVNCSNRNLTQFPSVLPSKTKILLLDRNQIRSLEPLISNPVYKDVQDLGLDNNSIDSIEDLEGSYWFSHFRVLSLRNNQLVQLPTYALDNALQLNRNMPEAVRIFLSGNPWKCDCAFIPLFQDLLRKYDAQIYDVNDIKCSYAEGDINSFVAILDLSRTAVCRLPSDYTAHILDLVNGILASLIILILAKLAYDYYHFKRTGRLPWIVTKIP